MGAGSSHELRDALEGFEIVRLLGKGAWGKVWLVRQGPGGKLFALKSLHRPSIIAENLVDHTRLEREVLLTCQSPFVISLHAAFCTTDSLYFVLDYVPGGSLWSFLCGQPDTHLSEKAARFYLAEMVLGIAELHRRGFVYRDVKPDNMLIQSDGHLVLTDFGLSHRLRGSERILSFSGSAIYIAPEVLLDEGHGKEVDWWGLGVVLHILLTGAPPLWSDNRKELFDMIRHAPIPLDDPLLSPSARALIKAFMDREPSTRLGARGVSEIQAHPFFQGLDWEAVERKELSPPWVPSPQAWQEEQTRKPDPHIDDGVRQEFADLASRLVEPGTEAEDDPFVDFAYLHKEMRVSGGSHPPRLLIRSFTPDVLMKKKKDKVPLLQASSLAGTEVKNKKKKDKPKRGHRRAFSIDALTSIGDRIEGAIKSDKRSHQSTTPADEQCPICSKKLTLSKFRCVVCSHVVCRKCCMRRMVTERDGTTVPKRFCHECLASPEAEASQAMFEYYCHDRFIVRADLERQVFELRDPLDGQWKPTDDPVLVAKMKEGRGALPSEEIANQLYRELAPSSPST